MYQGPLWGQSTDIPSAWRGRRVLWHLGGGVRAKCTHMPWQVTGVPSEKHSPGQDIWERISRKAQYRIFLPQLTSMSEKEPAE